MFGIKLPEIRIGGDIGKALTAVTAPIQNTVKAVESLGRGDLQGAAGNMAHAAFGSNPVSIASNASSTVKDALNSDIVNTLTLGSSRDIAEIGEKGLSAGQGRAIDASDWSSMGRQAIRGAAIVGAVMAAPMAASAMAGISAPSATTVGNTLAGASLLKTASQNPNEALAAVAEKYAPGSGDAVRTIQPIQGGNGVRQPATVTQAEPNATMAPSTAVIKSGNSEMVYIAIGAAALLGIALIIRLRK